MLHYEHTNETIRAIIVGLEPKYGDRILSVAGLGDQAFAFLSCGARVCAVDNDAKQTEYVRRRIRQIGDGDFSSFEDFRDYAPHDLNRNFFSDNDRRDRIRASLYNLEVADTQCIFSDNIDFSKFNKIYLSNAYDWRWTSDPDKKIFRRLSKALVDGALIYGSSNIALSKMTFSLRKNERRTLAAKSFEKTSIWSPVVFEKMGLSRYLSSFVRD